jgi:hypothetical protein
MEENEESIEWNNNSRRVSFQSPISNEISVSQQFPDNDSMQLDEDIEINRSSADYEIVGKWGAKVREGFLLSSKELGLIPCGHIVKVVGIKRNRARILEPYLGWVSITASYIKDFVILKKIDRLDQVSETDDALSRLMSKSLSLQDIAGNNRVNTVRKTTDFKKKMNQTKHARIGAVGNIGGVLSFQNPLPERSDSIMS